MPDRLTKSEVERLLAMIDDPYDDLVAALSEAVLRVHPGDDLTDALTRLGRVGNAQAIEAGEVAAAWLLAAELNELRRLEDRS